MSISTALNKKFETLSILTVGEGKSRTLANIHWKIAGKRNQISSYYLGQDEKHPPSFDWETWILTRTCQLVRCFFSKVFDDNSWTRQLWMLQGLFEPICADSYSSQMHKRSKWHHCLYTDGDDFPHRTLQELHLKGMSNSAGTRVGYSIGVNIMLGFQYTISKTLSLPPVLQTPKEPQQSDTGLSWPDASLWSDV